MQREACDCILHVFKSTFHFWLMITSDPRVDYSSPQPLLFFLACCPCFDENHSVWGCTASPGTWVISPHLLWWEYVVIVSLMPCLIEGLTPWSLVCCGVPQDSVGSTEVPALFTLSVSQACCELLVLCWALGVLRFLGFSGLRGSCINSLCERTSSQPCLITSCCLVTSGNIQV